MQTMGPSAPAPPDSSAALWPEILEDQLEVDLEELVHHPLSRPRRLVIGVMRVIALVFVALGVIGEAQLVRRGLGFGLAGAWVLPLVVLAAVLGVEKLFVRTRD